MAGEAVLGEKGRHDAIVFGFARRSVGEFGQERLFLRGNPSGLACKGDDREQQSCPNGEHLSFSLWATNSACRLQDIKCAYEGKSSGLEVFFDSLYQSPLPGSSPCGNRVLMTDHEKRLFPGAQMEKFNKNSLRILSPPWFVLAIAIIQGYDRSNGRQSQPQKHVKDVFPGLL